MDRDAGCFFGLHELFCTERSKRVSTLEPKWCYFVPPWPEVQEMQFHVAILSSLHRRNFRSQLQLTCLFATIAAPRKGFRRGCLSSAKATWRQLRTQAVWICKTDWTGRFNRSFCHPVRYWPVPRVSFSHNPGKKLIRLLRLPGIGGGRREAKTHRVIFWEGCNCRYWSKVI